MFGSRVHRCVLLIGLLSGLVMPDRSAAQSAGTRKDSLAQLKITVAEYETRIANADSSGDARESARQRIMLAPLCKRAEALKLYGEAALIADTADLFEDEELRARQGLVDLHRAAGNWRKAYEEAARVMVLTEEWTGLVAKRALDLERREGQAAWAQLDSTEHLRTVDRARSEAELKILRDREARWERSTWIGAGACVLMFAFLLLLLRRDRTAAKSEAQALRGELDSLRASMPPAPLGGTGPASITPVATKAAEPPVVVRDEVLLGMFRKRGPERLATLRDARARGDHEKVTRVVHTLKPQLTAIDAASFEALCAALTAKDAVNDQPRWNTLLDRLEAALGQLLQ